MEQSDITLSVRCSQSHSGTWSRRTICQRSCKDRPSDAAGANTSWEHCHTPSLSCRGMSPKFVRPETLVERRKPSASSLSSLSDLHEYQSVASTWSKMFDELLGILRRSGVPSLARLDGT